MQTLGALLACRFASCMAQAVTLWTNSIERLLSASLWDGRSWPFSELRERRRLHPKQPFPMFSWSMRLLT